MMSQTSKSGWSIIEVLIALAVFSVAISGLYIAMSSAQESLTTSMRRDMESAMVNTLVSEINPYDRLIETAYDQTTKQQLPLPDGGSVWYTRIVASENATADRKDVNVYFYRNQSDTTPYRQFRREISPDLMGYSCSDGTQPKYVKDSNGNIYSSIRHNDIFSLSAGSYTNGFFNFLLPDDSIASAAVTGTADTALFASHCYTTSGIQFVFFTTPGKKYDLIVGTYGSAGDATNRLGLVNIAGSNIDTYDAFTEVGANKALVKTYPFVSTGTMVNVNISQAGTLPPRITHIAIEKAD